MHRVGLMLLLLWRSPQLEHLDFIVFLHQQSFVSFYKLLLLFEFSQQSLMFLLGGLQLFVLLLGSFDELLLRILLLLYLELEPF